MHQIIIQLIGAIGFAGFGLAFFIKSRRKMFIVQSISLSISTIHFLLLGGWTGAALSFANAIKILLFSFNNDGNWASNKFWLYLFLGIFLVIGLITWEGYHSLLLMAAMVFNTVAYWEKELVKIRLIFAPQSVLWFIYDFIVGSYAGMFFETITFTSAVTSVLKIKRFKKSPSQS